MRRVLSVLTAAALALTLAGPVAAQGGPPDRTQEPVFGFVSDQSTYVLLVNITAEDFCAWVEDEFQGMPRVASLVTVQQKETGQGAVVETFRATVYAELWAIEGGDLGAICAGEGDLLGTGTVFWVSTDNDLFVSQSRTNSFGGALQGTIHGADGAWRVTGQFRAQITQDGEFRLLRESVTVRAR
jgi:hypothetical protein